MKTARPAPEEVTVKGNTVTIYWTPSVKNGKEYPGWSLSWTESGKRKRRSVANLDKARVIARSIAGQLSDGTGHAHALTPAEVADYHGSIRILRQAPGVQLSTAASTFAQAWAILPDAGDILTAVRQYRDNLKKQDVTPITVAALVADFIATKEKQGVSKRYISGCKNVGKRLSETFRCNVSGITSADLQGHLDRLKLGATSRSNHKRVIITLWRHASRKGYLPRKKSTEADFLDPIKPPVSSVGVYQPTDIATVLHHATGLGQLAVAIGAFAGMRSAEIYRMNWQDIGKKFITVAPEQAKTAARRLIPILPPLAAFLAKFTRGEGRIFSEVTSEAKLSTLIAATVRNAGVVAVHNGLRHSFCTYRLAVTQNAAQVSLEAGNSPAKLFRHYRELATKAQGAKWFAVRPAGRAKNVLEMPAKAA